MVVDTSSEITPSKVKELFVDELRKQGFEIKEIEEGMITAVKNLKPVGIKKRVIYFLITSADHVDKEFVKALDKIFKKKKPGGFRTFFFYNIVIITEKGYDKEAFRYIRDRMFETWNIKPMFIWDILHTSYTKITHLIDLKSKAVIYPYDLSELRMLIHREAINVIEKIMDYVIGS
jgi:hypothetical protein